MQKPALTEMLSGILLCLFRIYTNIGADKTKATTYPGFGARRIAIVFDAIRSVEKPMIYMPVFTISGAKTLLKNVLVLGCSFLIY